MGCDIHAAIEVQKNGAWEAVKFHNRWHGKWEGEPKKTARLDFGRNYCAFAILADVRNYDGERRLVPIASPRGLPDNISSKGKSACDGDHSETYLTIKDFVNYDWTQTAKRGGYVTAEVFEKWDRMKEWEPRPEEWCQGVGGGNVVILPAEEVRAKIKATIGERRGAEYQSALQSFLIAHPSHYCPIEWEETYAKAAGTLWVQWFPLMLKLSHEHKDVRMVMNFDN